MSPLTKISSGKNVKLVSIDGGACSEMRLTEMGFVPGVAFSVVNNTGMGPVTVNVKGSRLALGNGLAQKLLVQEC